MRKINKIIIISLATVVIFTGCNGLTSRDNRIEPIVEVQSTTVEPSINPIVTTQYTEKPYTDEEIELITQTPADECYAEKPAVKEKPYTDEEIELIAQTLAGECYDEKLKDKRLVAEVILNRVSNERFGESVFEVVTAKNQFYGYWRQSRPVSESDIQIAEETLTDWYANDCKALSEYLFFCSGPNRENVFRSEY